MRKVYFYLIGLSILIISFFLDNNIANFFANNKLQFFDSVAIFIHNIEFYVFFAFVLIILLVFKQKEKIIPLLMTFVLYIVTTQAIKIIADRPRPFTEFGFQNLGEENVNRSFPSGHATATASGIKFFEFNKIFFYIWIFITILVMFSRVYLGMHYFSDVIAGFILGYFISDASIFLIKKYKINMTS